MSLKNYNLSGSLVTIYLVFSVFYLLFLLFSTIIPLTATLLLFLISIPSLFFFFVNIKKENKNIFYRNFLILISVIYLMELPSFIPGINPLWRARLVMAHVAPDVSIYLSFVVIVLTAISAIKRSDSRQKMLSRIFYPRMPENEDKIALGTALFFFSIGFMLFILSFAPTLGGITAGLQLLLYTFFIFLLVKTYLHDGLPYGILLSAGFVSTMVYFEFSYIYEFSFIEMLWILPFVLAGFFYIIYHFFLTKKRQNHIQLVNG